MFLWVANFRGLTVGFAHLSTLSRTYITGHICLIENKIWVFHTGVGVDLPHLASPNTRDLLLLLFSCYTTISLNFGHCPISKLTTHSPRMVNNQYHAHRLVLMQCPHAYEMQKCHFILSYFTCKLITTYNIFNTLHVIQLSRNNMQKILELGPQSNEVSSSLNIQNMQKNKKNLFFQETGSLSRQRTPVAIESL